MKILLSPHSSTERLNVIKNGDALVVNGKNYDFAPIREGEKLPASATDCLFLVGEVARVNGDIELTLILPYGPDASPEVAFPKPIYVVEDGPVELPT